MRPSVLILVVPLLAISLVAGCGDDDTASAGPTPTDVENPVFEAIAGHVGWTADAPFEYSRPDNDMRDAQYDVAGHAGTELVVSHFDPEVGGGGDVQANVDRWVAQFQQPEGTEATVATRNVNDLPITTVDVHGTFVGRRGMQTRTPPQAGWRMLGAIAEGPEGLVFFKLLGPSDGVAAAEDAFMELVRSVHPE